ncbi:MAG: hypothetical protein II894_03215 [Bacteroidales bacterium]|nr:hypothetical protein [Bacteroidales bacterium]
MKKQPTPNDQRSEVMNPTSVAYIKAHKNTIKQLQQIPDKTPAQLQRQKERQRELSSVLAKKTTKK